MKIPAARRRVIPARMAAAPEGSLHDMRTPSMSASAFLKEPALSNAEGVEMTDVGSVDEYLFSAESPVVIPSPFDIAQGRLR